jgi:hypothetical protein
VAGDGEKARPERKEKGVDRAQATDLGRLGPWDEEVLASFVKVACHVKLMIPFLTIKADEGCLIKVACHVIEPLTHLLDLCKCSC